MSRIICVCGMFEVENDHGEVIYKELTVDYGINEDTLEGVPLTWVHPSELGATFDKVIGEWVIE